MAVVKPFSLRLFQPSEFDGPTNMAIDQALLESVASGAPGCLRFYTWKRPTLSLGYFQASAGRQDHAHSRNIDLVRRSSGGGAIVHHRELTYSLVVPQPRQQTATRTDLYEIMHGTVTDMLHSDGISAVRWASVSRPSVVPPPADGSTPPPFLCFQRRTDEDLLVAGYKVLGSAQRRSGDAVLQHGSLLLSVSPYAPELPGIAELSGARLTATEVAARWCTTLAENRHWRFQEAELPASVVDRAAIIRAQRFDEPSWTHRR
ncbi:biotin/lipoate A/B protein ligase family protein [Crateriforma conspicua]|uniref:Octanoyltransferase LipM n=1 Tax=Crateriforma conspicua TaxID=2527996 RepID=A0A5C6FUR7_9PLAN|nr:Octanoyltransferase LipM [Crateriforma conspicua]